MRAYIYTLLMSLMALSQVMAQDAQVRRGTRSATETTKPKTATSPLVLTPPSGDALRSEYFTWQKTLYRKLELSDEANATLIYPHQLLGEKQNLFTLIFKLIAQAKLKAYEYIDGEEILSDKYQLNFADLLSRFQLSYNSPEDIPSREVKAYYIKELNYFDQSKSRLDKRVLALCPILYDLGEYGEVPKPLFWVAFADLQAYLSQDLVQLRGDNEALRATLADYFALSMYRGEVVKTQNLLGKSLTELSQSPEELKKKQADIEAEIRAVGASISLPDSIIQRSNEGRASKKRSKTPKAPKSKAPKASSSVQRSARNLS